MIREQLLSFKARRPLLWGAAGLFLGLLLLLLHRPGLSAVDPDAVDFDRVGAGPGRYLICPPDLCASRDEEAPLFTVPAERLTQKLRASLLAEPRLREVPLSVPHHLRFVETSSVLQLDRVIDVRILPRSSGASTLAVLGRPASPLLDHGATRARLQRLTEAIAR